MTTPLFFEIFPSLMKHWTIQTHTKRKVQKDCGNRYTISSNTHYIKGHNVDHQRKFTKKKLSRLKIQSHGHQLKLTNLQIT